MVFRPTRATLGMVNNRSAICETFRSIVFEHVLRSLSLFSALCKGGVQEIPTDTVYVECYAGETVLVSLRDKSTQVA
eukprot:6204237-Pleurochrysis_carterae.AAC.1